jgi:aromatic-amino-acid transaminase
MFEHVPAYPGDPILSLNEDFQLDPRVTKVNLSIGIYFDADGKLPMLDSVRKAEAALLGIQAPRPYLPMSGLADYRDAAQALVFGADSEVRKANRVATVQTVGGSGALKVGADFLKRYFPASQVWISDPSWAPSTPIRTTTNSPAACASRKCWLRSIVSRQEASFCFMRAAIIRPASI